MHNIFFDTGIAYDTIIDLPGIKIAVHHSNMECNFGKFSRLVLEVV